MISLSSPQPLQWNKKLPNLASNGYADDSLTGPVRLRSIRRVDVKPVVLANKHISRVLLALMAGGLPAFSLADGVETAKLVAEDAFPLGAGRTELEFRYQHVTADTLFDNDGELIVRGELEGQIIVAKVTHGIKEGLDASIEVAWRDLIEDADSQLGDGIGNVTVNAKWLFYRDDEKGLAVGWIPGFTAPFAGDAVNERLAPGQDYWSINNLLVLTYVVGGFNLNVDVGHFLALGDERGDQRSEFIGDVALG